MINIRFVFIFLCLNLTLNAQIQQKRIPLIEVLETLEKHYNYRFNYLFETVDGILVTQPPKNISFQEAITSLEKQTNLKFSIVNSFVTITAKEMSFICGYIKDFKTNKPLFSATIQSKNSSVISNQEGYFQLEVKNENEAIVIRHLGYKHLKLLSTSFKKEICTNIYLETGIIQLQQVVLSNYLVKGINKLSDGSFEIDVSEFEILPGLIEPDVLQTVQSLPGIQSVNETVSNINIRAGSHDENLLLWDGIKMYQSGHFFGLISIFNPRMTSKVSLIKNGTSAHFTNGVSGTINMQTDDEIASKFRGSAGLNFLNLDAYVDIPIGNKSSLQISSRKGLSDFFKTPTYNSYFKRIKQNSELDVKNSNVTNSNVDFDFYDTSLRWLYNIDDKSQLRINFLLVNNELLFNENANLNGTNEARVSNLVQNSIGSGLFYKRIWNNKFQSSVQIYETDYKLKAINADILKNQRALQENKVSETGIKINTLLKITDRLSFLNGYQFTETKVTNFDDVDNPIYSLYVAEVLRTHGLYSQIEILSQNKKTNIKAGVRANYLVKFNKYILEPRLSFNQKINQFFNLEVLGELKHQATSQVINLQNDFLGVEKRRWQLSNNSTIPVIESKQISFGLQFNNHDWLVDAVSYFKEVEGITSQSQGFQNQYLLERTSGSYEVFGLDLLIRKQFLNFNTWFSYSYMNSNYLFKTLQDTKFPNNFDITNAVTFGTSYSLKNLKVSIGFNWHTGKPTTKPTLGNEISSSKINYEPSNSRRLDDYFRIDLSSTYQFNFSKTTKAELGFSAWNLFNQNNIIDNYYTLNDNDELEKSSKYSLDFTPNISFRVFF